MIKKYCLFIMVLACVSCDVSGNKQKTANYSPLSSDKTISDDQKNPIVDYIQIPIEKMNDIYHLTPQEALLNSCLSVNYYRLLGKSTNDGSPFRYSYHTIRGIGEFVEKEAGEFYREVLPHYSEGGTKYNAIFSRCLAFSKSKKTDDFLNALKPKECTQKENENLSDGDCPEYNY